MPTCAILGCHNKSSTSSLQKDGVTFHIFPKDPLLKRKWTQLCKRAPNWKPTRTATICSLHFETSQFQCLPSKRRKLVAMAIPTLFLPENGIENFRNSELPGTLQCISCIEKKNENEEITYENLNTSIELSTREKMIKKIKVQAKKIKHLQTMVRHLKKRVATLEEVLKTDDRSLIDRNL